MSAHSADPLDHPEVRILSAPAALVGTLLALAAMAFALVLTLARVAAPFDRMVAVGCLAGLALLAQALCLFRLGIGEAQIWKTIALLLVLPLFVVTIGLTDFMFHSLQARTMLHMTLHGAGAP